jgi:hypothetical protein
MSARDGWVNFIFYNIFSAYEDLILLPMGEKPWRKKSKNHCTLTYSLPARIYLSLQYRQKKIVPQKKNAPLFQTAAVVGATDIFHI